jgi:hypothetical protein
MEYITDRITIFTRADPSTEKEKLFPEIWTKSGETDQF